MQNAHMVKRDAVDLTMAGITVIRTEMATCLVSTTVTCTVDSLVTVMMLTTTVLAPTVVELTPQYTENIDTMATNTVLN